jgi:hypothetical protein
MKVVKAFEVSDGRIFPDQEQAIKAEFAIEVRGFMVKSVKPGERMPDVLPIDNFCRFVANNPDGLMEVIRKNKNILSRVQGTKARLENLQKKATSTVSK